MRRRLGAPLLFLLLLLLLPGRSLGASPTEILLDEDSYRPYGLCPGTLRSAAGFTGLVEVRGRLFDGTDMPLFRTRLSGWTESLDFLFIPDGKVRSLFIAGTAAELELPLPGEGLRNAKGQILLDSLDPPFRFSAPAFAPRQGPIRARSLQEASLAAARLFVPVRDRAALGILLAFTGAAIVLACLRGRLGKAALPVLVLLSLAGSLGSAAAARRPPAVYRLSLPDAHGPYEIPTIAERREEPGYTLVSFGGDPATDAAGKPALAVLGIRSPAERPLPLSAFPESVLLKFRDQPLVTRAEDGAYSLVFDSFTLGWALYE